MSLFMFCEVIAMVKSIRRRPKGVPQLLKHMVRGKAYAYALFDGVRHSYGKFDAEARRLFDSDFEAWKSNGCRWPGEPGSSILREGESGRLDVAGLVERYKAWLRIENECPAWWRNNGVRIEQALRVPGELFATLAADEFGKTHVTAVRDAMHGFKRPDGVTPRLSRATVTERLRIVRNMFDWAVSEGLICGTYVPEITTTLRHLSRRKKGRPKSKRSPVPRWVVDATLPFLSRPVGALVELMWWTPARPSELFGLRSCDIDQSQKDVWLVALREHKMAGHESERTIKFGPKCISALMPFMQRLDRQALFRPVEAMAEVALRRRADRNTPLWPSHVDASRQAFAKNSGCERPRRVLGETYSADTFRRAIHRAVERANRERERLGQEPLPRWNPYDLRHAAITRIAEVHGRDGAQAAADHRESATTDIYCHTSLQLGIRIARASS